MTGTILENISKQKLILIVTTLLLCLVPCFLVGGLIAPKPVDTLNILGTPCYESFGKNGTSDWFYNRGNGRCNVIDMMDINETKNVVFVFQMPVPRKGSPKLEFSRWQQILKGVIALDVQYSSETEAQQLSYLTIDARLAYQNKGDPEDSWKFLAKSVQKRLLDCGGFMTSENRSCYSSAMPLFKIGSLFQDYYLLNVRFPDESNVTYVQDVWLNVINQNEQYTKVWISLKTVFFPFGIGLAIWFGRRIFKMQRKPVLLERMLLSLGIGVCLLNMPLEYLTLYFDLPLILFFADVRQTVFYAKLFSFWLVFTGEHMLIQDASARSSLKRYWRQLCAVIIVCIVLFVLDVFERGIQLKSPFYSVWFADLGMNLKFIILGISTGLYFIWLCYMVWQVFINIAHKRPFLPAMSNLRRLHYEGTIYRFKILVIFTLLCAALTIISFILGQIITEGQLKWDEHFELEYSSAFFTGVYGMWNLYIFAVIILYSPSHKLWSEKEIRVSQSMNKTDTDSQLT